MKGQSRFDLYIPSKKRIVWTQFREHLENKGEKVCDVLTGLIEAYMAAEKRTR